MAGRNHHFSQFAPEKTPDAIKRYIDETARLHGVLDKRLADNDFVVGSEYSIADMAIYPWIVSHKWQSQNLEDFPRSFPCPAWERSWRRNNPATACAATACSLT